MADILHSSLIAVGVDASGVDAGVAQAKKSLADLGAAGKAAGADASTGIDAIGTGAAGAATKFDAATKGLIGSIQRLTAATQAGSKSSSDYFRELANQRGVSADVLSPYLAQLEKAQAAQKAAAASAQDLGKSVGTISGTGVASAGHAMEGLSFHTSAAKRELLVLTHELSQGNFSRFGASLLVLGERTGAASLLFSGAGIAAIAFAAAVAGVAVAVAQGASQTATFNKEIILSGNAAGATIGTYTAMATALAKVSGSQGAALETVSAFIKAGNVGAESLQRFASIGQQLERLVGQPVAETAKQFSELGKSPLEAAVRLNEQYNFLTASIYSQIRALTEQGRALEAAKLAQDAYAGALESRMPALQANVGSLERGWNAVTAAIKGAVSALQSIGRTPTLQEQLAVVSTKIANGRAPFDPSAFGGNAADRANLQANLQVQASLQEQIRLAQRAGEASAQNAQQTKARAAWEDIVNQNLTKQQQLEREIQVIKAKGLADGRSEAEIQTQIAAARARLSDNGAAQTGENALAGILARTKAQLQYHEQLQATIRDQTQLNDLVKPSRGEEEVLRLQEQLKTSITGVTRASIEKQLVAARGEAVADRLVAADKLQIKGQQESLALHLQQIDAARNSAEQIKQQALGQEAVNAAFGKSKTALEQMTLAQMQAKFAEADAFDSTDPKYIASLQQKIDWQKRYVTALQDTEYRQEALKQSEASRVNQEDLQTLQLELSLVGQTQQVRETILAQRKTEVELAKQLAEIDKLNLGDGPEAEAKRAELRAKATANAEIAASNAASKVVVEQWTRAADEINTSLTDAFISAFDRSKTLAQALRDSIKQLFDNLVLRPVISAVMSPISGAINSVVSSGINSFLGGNGSSLLSAGGSLASSGGFFSTLFGGGAAASTTATASGGFELAASSGAFNSAIAGSSTAAAGAGAAGALASIPVAGWIALGAMFDMAQNKKAGISPAWSLLAPGIGVGMRLLGVQAPGGPKDEGGFAPNGINISGIDGGGSVQGSQRGDIAGAKAISDGISTGLTGLAKQFGVTLAEDIGVFFAKDPKGTSQTQLQIVSSNYNRGTTAGGIENVGRSDQEFQDAIKLATAQLDLTELAHALTGKIGDYLKALDPASLTADQIAADIQLAANAKTLYEAFDQLGPTFKGTADLTVAGMNDLATAMGGVQSVTAQLADYQKNFYTAAEQRSQTINNIVKSLADGGLSITADQVAGATRDQFRSLVESLDLTTAAGQKSFVALMNVEGAFSSLTGTAADAAAKIGAALQLFGRPGESANFQATQIQSTLHDAGLDVTTSQILNATTTQVRDLYDQLMAIGNTRAAAALVDVSGALAGLIKQNADAQDQLRIATVNGYANGIAAFKQQIADDQAALAATQSKLKSTFDSYVASVQPLIDSLNSQADTLAKARDALAGEGLTGTPRLTQARQALFGATADTAPGLVTDYLKQAADSSRTQLDYLRAVATGRGVLKTQEDNTREMANNIAAQVNATRALINPLLAIDDQVKDAGQSIVDAILATQAAQAKLAADQASQSAYAAGLAAANAGSLNSPVQQQGAYTLAPLASYAVGTDYVPRTGPYTLHEGEAVVTREVNLGGGQAAKQLRDEMRQMHTTMKAVLAATTSTAVHTGRSARTSDRWDANGLPVTNPPSGTKLATTT